ncbi:TDT family transporter [Oscillospiraceae bacterium PP1C4]
MKSFIKKIPVPLAGLMLALAATGNLLSSYSNFIPYAFGTVSAILLLLLAAKAVLYPQMLREDLSNPVMASVAPTFSMGFMLLASYLVKWNFFLSLGLWYVGFALHCIFIVYFTIKFMLKFDLKKIFPSCFIVYVGLVVASITAPVYQQSAFGQIVFWFGFICYLMLLPVILYRVWKVKQIPEPLFPLNAIFAAPASLCLAGYISSFTEKNIYLIGFMVILSLTMYVCVLVVAAKALKAKFHPSFSAMTFPLVISAIALKQTNGFLTKAGTPIAILNYIVLIQTVLAVAMVVYVLWRYMKFLFAPAPNMAK